MIATQPLDTGLILSGGLALGAYQQGALEVLLGSPRVVLRALAGTSIGAINAAILAGNSPEDRIAKLAAFWEELISDKPMAWTDPLGLSALGPGQYWRNWLNVAAVRLGGNPPLFRPRSAVESHEARVPSLYMVERTLATLERYVDFELLNDGRVRFCCAATDIETGECVVFDTAAGVRITPEHVLASGSLLPAFPPTPIGERLLGDGGFAANAPLEPFLASNRIAAALPLCLLIDLFAADALPPRALEKVAERSTDLKYACQTEMRLAGIQRERDLELQIESRAALPGTDLIFLRCQGRPDDTGPEKVYDFSRSSLADRAKQGAEDAREALRALPTDAGAPGLRVHRV